MLRAAGTPPGPVANTWSRTHEQAIKGSRHTPGNRAVQTHMLTADKRDDPKQTRVWLFSPRSIQISGSMECIGAVELQVWHISPCRCRDLGLVCSLQLLSAQQPRNLALLNPATTRTPAHLHGCLHGRGRKLPRVDWVSDRVHLPPLMSLAERRRVLLPGHLSGREHSK
jgi:hypothetical protein